MITAWILMYALNTGKVVVYNVYTNQSQCEAVAYTLKNSVSSGVVECVGITLAQKGPAE